jgi:hypothetical protein
VAGYFWGRHRRATATALINAGAVLGVSMFTDYPGALRRIIPFEDHGKADVGQALLATGLPVAMGFSGEAASTPFQLQSINEFAVISTTDWQSPEEEKVQQIWRRAS